MTQTYKVQVGMNQAHIVESGFVWKQGDFGFNIEIEVLDFDTTGATPQIIFRKSTGAVEATEISVAGNKFTYAIRGTELDTPGPCICDLKLNDSTTKRVSTASFKYFVIPDTMDGLEQEASSYSDTIEQLLENTLQKSLTAGLVKNDGSINTTLETMVTNHEILIDNLEKSMNPITKTLVNNLIDELPESTTINNIIVTNQGNKIKLNGQASSNTVIYIKLNTNLSETGFLFGCPENGMDSTFFLYAQTSDGTNTYKDFGDGISIPAGTYNVAIMVRAGIQVTDLIFEPIFGSIYTQNIVKNIENIGNSLTGEISNRSSADLEIKGRLNGFEQGTLNSVGINLIQPTLANTIINDVQILKNYDVDGNLQYTFNGTASEQIIAYVQINLLIPFDSLLGKSPSGASDNTFFICAENRDTHIYYKAYDEDIAIPAGSYNIYILVRNSQALSNIVFYPTIRSVGSEQVELKNRENNVLTTSLLDYDLFDRYNLLNVDDIVDGKYLANTYGVSTIESLNSASGVYVSNIIPTYNKHNKFYINTNGVFIGFYGINKIIRSGITNTESEVDIPEGTYFIRFYASTSQKNIVASFSPINEKYGYKNLNIYANQPLVGKKWVAIGDSLTEINNTASRNYTLLCSEQLGLKCENFGVSGSGYWRKHNTNQSFMDRALTIPTDAEIITVFGSGNDMKNDDGEVPTDNMIGQPSDATLDTWCGYVNQTLDNILSRVPAARLGIISPTPWSGTAPDFNNTMKKMSIKLGEICERRSIPFLNLYLMSNLRPWDSNQNDCFAEGNTTTNTHPNNKGNLIYYGRIREFLKTL